MFMPIMLCLNPPEDMIFKKCIHRIHGEVRIALLETWTKSHHTWNHPQYALRDATRGSLERKTLKVCV